MARKFTATTITLGADSKLAAETATGSGANGKGHTTPNALRALFATQDAALDAKTTPVDADFLSGYDSAAGNARKKFTFGAIWTWLLTKLSLAAVRHDVDQTLDGTAQAKARANIGAVGEKVAFVDESSAENVTLSLAWSGKHVLFQDPVAVVLVPNSSDVSFPEGSVITLTALEGGVEIIPDDGVTIIAGGVAFIESNQTAQLMKLPLANHWLLI